MKEGKGAGPRAGLTGWTCVLLLSLLAGCGTPSELARRAVPEAPAPERYGALQYFGWLRQAPAGELRAEEERLEREWPRASVIDRTQLALLLSASALTDDDKVLRARQILESVMGEMVLTQRSRDYHALAELWRSVLLLRDTVGQAEQELESARAELVAARRNAEALRGELADAGQEKAAGEQRAEELEVQIKALKKQIEALTSIEQQLIEREQSQGQP